MNFLKNLFGRNSRNINRSHADTNHVSNEDTLQSATDDISLSEKYPGLDDEQLYWFLEDKEFNGEILTAKEKQFLVEQGWAQLASTLYSEHMYGRSLAIKELINGNYKIFPSEHGNPLKELINFTLLYFKRYFADTPVEAENLLRDNFPIMFTFIKRQIGEPNTLIAVDEDFDDQKAYDEFLFFCKRAFRSLYPDAKRRDEQLKHHFKFLHNDIKRFIEQDEK